MVGTKVYLGDSVYAKYTGDGIELTCNNGAENRQRIFLENDTLLAFDKFKNKIIEYVRAVKKQLEENAS